MNIQVFNTLGDFHKHVSKEMSFAEYQELVPDLSINKIADHFFDYRTFSKYWNKKGDLIYTLFQYPKMVEQDGFQTISNEFTYKIKIFNDLNELNEYLNTI